MDCLYPIRYVVISCYGINEMGTAMADPFNWTSPSHDLGDLGRRLARESAQIHDFKRIFLGNIREASLGNAQAVIRLQSLGIRGSADDSIKPKSRKLSVAVAESLQNRL